ncbi:MAG: glutathione peroxidase [Elsteraceae bacterium]
MSEIYRFSAKRLDGEAESLEIYKDQVLLIVNTASQCGFTNQYEGLEALQRRFHARGFNVLGFPCNQFGSQEPGSSAEIKTFCSTRYDVSFPMFAKIDVNGSNAHPLWAYLKSQKGGMLGSGIKWNFTKFLIGRSGKVIGRFPPQTKPSELAGEIEALLGPAAA